jgi:hypothetical protein
MRVFKTNQGTANNQPVEVGTPVKTDAKGLFKITSAPVGFFKLMADGTTATQAGKQFPTLEYDIVTVAGQDNGVGSPIYLPELDATAKVCVNATTGGVLTLPKSPGFSLAIAPGAATFPGGSKIGCVTVTPVNPDKVPMVPGFGQQPRFVVTIQPVGTTFNPPAAITMPNMDALVPNAKTEMYSFDHDLASFVAIGTGTVSQDGSTIASDPGVGVIKAGWHGGGNPNPVGSAGTCPECQKCSGSTCVPDNLAIPTQVAIGDCKREACVFGVLEHQIEDLDAPLDICKECKKGLKKITGSSPKSVSNCCFDGEVIPLIASAYDTLVTKCVQRTQILDAVREHYVDGCSSVPNDPMRIKFGPLLLAPVDSTSFGQFQGYIRTAGNVLDLPCNQHDICYQTCKSDRKSCDDAMELRMNSVCDAAYKSPCPYFPDAVLCLAYFAQRAECFATSHIYWDGLRALGLAPYEERQTQYCQCCP